jgi:hypothetical protein
MEPKKVVLGPNGSAGQQQRVGGVLWGTDLDPMRQSPSFFRFRGGIPTVLIYLFPTVHALHELGCWGYNCTAESSWIRETAASKDMGIQSLLFPGAV